MKELQEGHLVLAMCILAEKYTCPEKGFFYFYHRIPLCNQAPGGGRTWISADIVAEWKELRESGMSYYEIANLFGTSHNMVMRKIKEQLNAEE